MGKSHACQTLLVSALSDWIDEIVDDGLIRCNGYRDISVVFPLQRGQHFIGRQPEYRGKGLRHTGLRNGMPPFRELGVLRVDIDLLRGNGEGERNAISVAVEYLSAKGGYFLREGALQQMRVDDLQLVEAHEDG